MIVQVGCNGPIELEVEAFQSERELEDLVCASPNLLAKDGQPRLAFVRRQVPLEGAGILDVLLLASNGLPVVAEVKLARNAQSRREIVGQVIDYVSALTSLTVDELDQIVDGGIEVCLRSFLTGANDDETFDSLWQSVGGNLRAGMARYVLVLDDVPQELERIVRFLALRSNLDIALVAINRHRDREGRLVLVPYHVVASTSLEQEVSGGPLKSISRELQSVVTTWDAAPPEGLRTYGRAHNYRQVKIPSWPPGLHYEFLKYSDGIGVELHIESDAALPAAQILQPLAGPPRPGIAFPLQWDPLWTRNRGRLMVKVSFEHLPEAAIDAMTQLTSLTRPLLDSIGNQG